jgi:WD40 repeat protein
VASERIEQVKQLLQQVGSPGGDDLNTPGKQASFYSRTLAAVVAADCVNGRLGDGFAAITDGRGDLGVDAVMVDNDALAVWLLTVKWTEKDSSFVDSKSIQEIIDVAQKFVSGEKISGASPVLNSRLVVASRIMRQPNASLTVMIVHAGRGVQKNRLLEMRRELRASASAGQRTAIEVVDLEGIEQAIDRLVRRDPAVLKETGDEPGGLSIIDLALTAEGNEIVAATTTGALQRWTADTAELKERIFTQQPVVAVAVTADGQRVVCGGADGVITHWDTAGSKMITRFNAHTGAVHAVALLGREGDMLSAGADGLVHRWDLSHRVKIHEMRICPDPVFAMVVTSDERHVITAGADGSLRKHDLTTLQQVGAPWAGHGRQVNKLSLSQDGRQVVSASDDGTLRRWDVATGRPVGKPLVGHEGFANAATFAAGGTAIVSVGHDGTIRSWNLTAEGPGEVLARTGVPLHSIVTSSDRSTGFAAGDDGRLHQWTVTSTAESTSVPEAADEPDRNANLYSDRESPTDSLGMAADVRRLATILGARAVAPPLSIALLGDWGTGKSSFMRQLQGELGKLTARAAAATGPTAFVSHLRQVSFNAWHYSDDHLWVGLIEHMFRELARPEPVEAEDTLERRAELEAKLAAQKAEEKKLQAGLTTIDRIDVSSGWLAALRKPRQAYSIVRVAVVGLARELKTWRAWGFVVLTLALIAGVVLSVRWGSEIIAWIGSVVGVLGALLVPVLTVRKKLTEWTEKAHRKLVRDKAELHKKIQESETELDKIAPERRLASLLAEIADSARYERFRGLVGLIHDDLCRLDSALKAARSEHRPDTGGPPLQRIVLYVDDLDRCMPERVMDILQAVNLLLSMELFMVVVAVDPRWLKASIETHLARSFHPGRADAGAPGSSEPGVLPLARSADPLEYLDKIFHIPFTVRPMGDRAADYVRELLPVADDDKPERPEADVAEPAVTPNTAETGRPEPQAGGDEPDGEASATDPVEPAPSAGASGDDQDAREEPAAENVDLNPENLRIHRAEQESVAALSVLLPTPRAVKKFSNLYRLLRLSVPPERLAEFVRNEHRVAAMLLAVLVCKPGVAKDVFRRVEGLTDDDDVLEIFTGAVSLEELRRIDAVVPLAAEPYVYRHWAKKVARFGFETYTMFVDSAV